MTAVFRHEVRLLFSGLTAYVYGAFSKTVKWISAI